MHLYKLAYLSMHESCLLLCHPCFNTMKLWTSDPNLHLSLANTTFCLFACFLALLVFLFVCLSCCLSCLLPHAVLAMSIVFIFFMPISCTFCAFFFHRLSASFLSLPFACTHMERGRTELRHDPLGANKKGVLRLVGLGV